MLTAIVAAGVASALLAWLAGGILREAVRRYRAQFTAEARVRLGEAFVFIDPTQVWTASIACCAASAAIAWLASGSVVAGAAAGAAMLAVPRWLAARWRRRRLARFDAQLPDTLAALASALRAGASVQAALRVIVERSDAPLGQEFGLMLREQRLGVPFEAALGHLYERMPSEAAGLVVASLRIAAQTGGNLAATLERIAETLRARLHLQGRIRALTAQGRLQAWVVGCLPPLMALVLDALEPDAMALLWHTPAGWCVLGLVAMLELVGTYMIRRIVAIEV